MAAVGGGLQGGRPGEACRETAAVMHEGLQPCGFARAGRSINDPSLFERPLPRVLVIQAFGGPEEPKPLAGVGEAETKRRDVRRERRKEMAHWKR